MSKKVIWTLPSAFAVGLIGWACMSDAQTIYEFSVENFDAPTTIDNPFWPHPPGTKYVYEGFTVEEGERVEHTILLTITDLTKVIGGVNSVVIYERDVTEGVVVEAELAFRAQDNEGNVWHLGEYSEAYEDGELVGGKTWLVGHLEGARAGVMMQGDPQPGTPAFSEGFAPSPVSWTDFGRIREIGQSDVVEYGSFNNVVVLEEFNEEEPGAFQIKSYAHGTGLIRVSWSGADEYQEELELVDVIHLTPEELAEERAEALELETRAYVYGQTPPAEQRTDMGGS